MYINFIRNFVGNAVENKENANGNSHTKVLKNVHFRLVLRSQNARETHDHVSLLDVSEEEIVLETGHVLLQNADDSLPQLWVLFFACSGETLLKNHGQERRCHAEQHHQHCV